MSDKLSFTKKTRNYFYDLPKVLQDYIYFFDDTYRELNNLCIKDMKKIHKINIRSCFIMGPYHIGQIIDKDQNRKEDLGTIKTKILNLVGKNRDTLGYINLPANQQKKTLPVHEILNLLKKLMQTGDEKEQQKNNLNQKIQR